MRVVVLLNSLYTGGAEFSTLLFYQWFRNQGHDVGIVCVKKATPSYDPVQFGFEEVHYLKQGSYIARAREFIAYVKKHRPQLVHSILYEANMLGRAARIRAGNFIHLESLVNEMYSPYRLNDPHVTWLKLKGYQLLDRITQRWGTDHFHANGNSVARHYQDKLGIPASRITVVNRGRADNPFRGDGAVREQLRSDLQINSDTVVLIIVARHEFQKGYDVLIDALALLETARSWVCLCAGREGNSSPAIQTQVRARNLENRIKILGHREDIEQLLILADIFVFPTRFEGLPGALIEAEAAGLPIVCTDIPNNLEVVEVTNALLFPVDDARLLSVHLNDLIEDDDKRKQLGAQSRLLFEKRFDLEMSHTKMHALLHDLIPA